MSTTIDQRIVSMKFDNAGFSSGVKETLSDLQGLDRKLEQSASGSALSGLQSSINSITFEKMAQNIDDIASHFTVLGRAWDLTLGQMMYSATKWGLDTAKAMSIDNVGAGFEKFGQKTTSVSTLLAQGFDLDEIDEQLEKLNWFSDETSYSFTDMVDNIAKFTASGRDLEESSTALMGIANWAALSGQNAQTASRAMYQLSQAMGAGVMRKQDYMSVQNANMDTQQFRQMAIDAAMARGTLKELEKGVYKSTVGSKDEAFTIDQFTEQLTKGAWFTSDVMMDVFNQYASAVDQIYDYVNNSDVDTTSQAIEEMSALGIEIDDFGKTAFLAAQQARTWTDVIDSVKDAASTGWMKIFGYIFGNTEETIDLFTDMANELWEVFVGPVATIADLMKEWYDFGGRTALWEGLGALWSNLTGILNAFGDALGIIFPLFEEGQGIALANATSGFAEFMKSIALSDEELVTLADTMAGLMLPLSWIFDLVSQIWGVLKPSLFGDTGSLLGFIGEKLKELSAYFTGADESVKGFNTFIAGLVDNLLHFLHGGYLDQLTQFVVFMSGAFATAIGVFGKILGFIGGKVAAFKGAVLDKLGGAFGAFMNSLQAAFKIAMNIPAAFVFIGSTVKNLIDGIKDAIKQFFDFEKISGAVGTAFSLLFGGLYLTITGTASLGEMIIGIGKNIVDFFKRIHTAITEGNGIAGFIEVLKTKVTEAATALTENFKKFINVEQFAKTIGVAFDILNTRIAAITGIDLAKIFKAIGAIAQKIVKPFTKLKFVLDNLKTTFSDLKESVKKFFDFKGMFSTVGDAIGEFWATVHDGITNASTFASVTDAVGAAFEALGKTIHDKFLEKFKIGEFFSDLKTELGNFASGMQEGFLSMLGFGETTDETQQAVEQLGTQLENASTTVEEPATAFSDLKKIIELVKQDLETFGASIGTTFKTKFGKLTSALKKVAGAFKTLKDNLGGALPNLKEIIKKHVKLKGVAEDVSKAFKDLGDKLWEAFSGKKSVPQRIEDTKKAFKELIDAIKGAFKENLDFTGLWAELSGSFDTIYEEIKNFFKEDFDGFFKTVTDGAKETWDAIKPYEEDTFWEAIVNNVGRLKEGFGDAKENAKGLVDALKETKVYQDAAGSINAMVEAVEKTTVFQVISGAIGTVKQGVEDLVKTFKESDTGVKLAEIWGEFTTSLNNVDWTTPSTALASISTSLSSMLGSLNALKVDKLNEFVESLDQTIEDFAKQFVGVYNVYTYLKNFKDNVTLLVKQGVEGLADGLTEADWDKIFDRAFGIIGFVIIIRLLAMINQIGETAGVIGTIAKNVKKFTGQLNSILMGTKWLFMAEMFKGLALAVVAIAGALFVLAAVPDQDLSKAVAAIVAIIFMFTIFAAVKGAFSKVADAASEAGAVKDKIETLKDAIGTLADAVREGLKKASLFFSIGVMIAAIGFVVWAFTSVIQQLTGLKEGQFEDGMRKIGFMLASVVLVIAVLALISKRVGTVQWDVAAVLVAMAAMLWVVVQAFKVFDQIQNPDSIEKGIAAMRQILLYAALLIAAMTQLPADKSTILAMVGLLGAIAVFMLVMMIPIAILSSLAASGNLDTAMGCIMDLAFMVSAVAVVLGLLAKSFTAKGVDFLDYAVVIGSLVVIALAMVVMAGVLMMLSTIPANQIGDAIFMMGMIAVALGGMTMVLGWLAETISKPNVGLGPILAAVLVMFSVAAAFLLMAVAIGVMCDVAKEIASTDAGAFTTVLLAMGVGLLAFVVLAVIVAGIVKALNLEAALIAISLSILVISASILVLAYAAGVLASSAPMFMENFKAVALTLVTLAAALLILGIIGKFASGGLLSIAAVLGAVAVVIMVIVAAIVIFAAIVPDTMESTLGDLMAKADLIANVIAALIYALAVGLVRGLAAAIPPIVEALGQMLGQLWLLLVQGLGWIVQGLADWIVNDGPSRLLQAILIVIDTILIAILEVLGPIAEFFGGTTENLINDLEAKVTEHASKAGYNTGEAYVEGTQKALDETPLDYSGIQKSLDEGSDLTVHNVEVPGIDGANTYWNSFTGGIGPNPLQYSGTIILPGAEQGTKDGEAYGGAYYSSVANATDAASTKVTQAAVNTNEAAAARGGEAYGKVYDPTMTSVIGETTANMDTQVMQATVETNTNAGVASAEAYGGGFQSTFAGFTQTMQNMAGQTGIDMGSLIVAGNAEGMTASTGELNGAVQTLNTSIAGGFGGLDLTSIAGSNMDGMLGEYASYAPDMTNTASLLNSNLTGELENADTEGAAQTNVNNYTGLINGRGSQEAASAGGQMGNSGANALGQTSGSYYTSASHVVDGAVTGIRANMDKYIRAVIEMAVRGNIEFNRANVVKSPSRLFAESTRWVVLGAAKGVTDNSGVYISSLTDMASRSNKAFAAVAADLNSYDFSNINGTPTITPVLDMSNVRNGMANVSDLFNNNVNTVSAGLNITSRFDEVNAYANQLAAASRQGNNSVMQAIERQTRRTEELIAAVRQGNRIYLDGKTLVGGIINDIDNGLGSRTQKWARGV